MGCTSELPNPEGLVVCLFMISIRSCCDESHKLLDFGRIADLLRQWPSGGEEVQTRAR